MQRISENMSAKGVNIRQSQYSVKVTMDLLQEFLLQSGITVYARINQQAEAGKTGQLLFPLEFILFGNPKSGGPLMIENPLVALDLPLKVIAWEDDQKKVWLAYNSAAYIEHRYSLIHKGQSPLTLDGLLDLVFKKS